MSSDRQLRPAPFSYHVATSTAVATLAGGAFVLLAIWAALGALLVAGMSCDDACAGAQPPPGEDWTQYSDAAQWTVLGLLAGANVAIALVSAALVFVRRRGAASLLVLLFTAISVALVAMLEQARPSPISWVWLFAAALGVITAVAARRRRARE